MRFWTQTARCVWMLSIEMLIAALACGLGAGTQSPKPAPKPTVDVGHVVQAVENHYRDANTLQADFLERYSEGGKQSRVESGRVFFARAGRMRWEYQSPETKLFVSDGKTLWFYVPQDHTATRQLVKQSDDWRTPLALLTRDVRLSRLCGRIELGSAAPLSDGQVVLRCWPRGEAPLGAAASQENSATPLDSSAGFTEVFLEANPASGELSDVRVEQPGGVELEFRFGAWRINPPLSHSLFEFEPPIGVAIIPADTEPDFGP